MNSQTVSDADLEELDQFLLSDAVSDEAMPLSMLDGYLTAIVSGPNTLPMSQWLHCIWGPDEQHAPEFETEEHAQHILGLIFARMNEIIALQQAKDGQIEPIFDINKFPGDDHEYTDGEIWAYGFVQGMQLDWDAWQPLLATQEGQAWFRPIYLLGADEVSAEDETLVRWPKQREEYSEQIPFAVKQIFSWWQPYRQAVLERTIAKSYARSHPKVGRNDPCPCGSGKKFKKCCGTATVLH